MIERIASVGFTVSNLEAALDFYTRVLPFEKIAETEVMGDAYERLTGVFGARMRVARLRLGQEHIHLTEYIAPPGGRPIPADSRSNDGWFQHIAIVVSDMAAAYDHLRGHRVQHVSTAPQTLPETIPNAAGISAFYFRDPDGHNLELIHFPPDKGAARWQNTAALFLGIDHTALASAHPTLNEGFYLHALKLQAAGDSLNFGTEQEHLNGVFGCRVAIVGWRAPAGIGVEQLHYIAPPGGRPTPPDTRANDLWHWEIVCHTPDVEAFLLGFTGLDERRISSAVVTLPADNPYGLRRGCLFRDSDGHAWLVGERL